MKHRYFRFVLFLGLLVLARAAQAQLSPEAQLTKLSVAQLMSWTATGPTALPANVSRVPLATRQNTLATQLNPAQSFAHKVNYIPDGMAGFAGYLTEQPRFNLYNFTHWQYIDVLTWFDGPVAIPTRPWVETAHRNGVKVIGSVFTTAADVAALVQKDAAGNYIGAQKLVDVANYYGFDGWFFNEESGVSTATATELRNLFKQLQTLRPAGMEMHWYDAMLPSGGISYQNALNSANQLLLQEGSTRVNDAMFTNYFWSGASNINTSVNTATTLGRSPFDVYMGADLWPNRSNQSLFTQTAWIDNYFTGGDLTQPRLSFGLFAANLTYNGGFNAFNSNAADYANFYRTEQRMFAGNDLDPVTPDASGWKGFGHYVPVRSVINTLPFETAFSVGQGRVFANNGTQLTKSWTDMARQSLLPSWQWARTGATTVAAGFDFSRAWYAGNSIKLEGSLAAGTSSTVKLYQTRLAITAPTTLDLTFKAGAAGASSSRLALYFSDNLAVPEYVDLGTVADTLWTTRSLPLAAYAGRELAVIGVQATSAAAVAAYRLNLGRLKVYNAPAAATLPVASFSASATTVTAGQSVTFSNASTNAGSYVWTFAGGTPASSTAVFPVVSYATPGTYAVKLRAQNATGRDSLTRPGYITVLAPGSSGGNFALLYDGSTKYVDAGTLNLSGAALTLECWVKVNAFKTAFPYISSLVGMEASGVTALLRLGDASLAASKVQFVLNVNGADTKVPSNTALVANTWYHLAATYDGVEMKIYINGALDASQIASGPLAANGIFALGRNYDDSRILNGSLDEVRVFTRALTATEVAASPCQIAPATAGLEGYWRCDEGSGLATSDATGHGHNGTLVNMTPTDWSTNTPTQCATTSATRPSQQPGLEVLVFGNPVPGGLAEIEVPNAAGQPLQLQLTNALGAVVWQQEVSANPGGRRLRVPLPPAAGLYLLRVSAPGRAATVKLLKP
ncbi:MAG: PKD domain-containing protein [Bacteroidota bacterium]|nr:PKD domain-containing protein [Bacteroidota bacterium]